MLGPDFSWPPSDLFAGNRKVGGLDIWLVALQGLIQIHWERAKKAWGLDHTTEWASLYYYEIWPLLNDNPPLLPPLVTYIKSHICSGLKQHLPPTPYCREHILSRKDQFWFYHPIILSALLGQDKISGKQTISSRSNTQEACPCTEINYG